MRDGCCSRSVALFFFFPSSFPFFVGGGEFCLSQKKLSKTFCFVKDVCFCLKTWVSKALGVD